MAIVLNPANPEINTPNDNLSLNVKMPNNPNLLQIIEHMTIHDHCDSINFYFHTIMRLPYNCFAHTLVCEC